MANVIFGIPPLSTVNQVIVDGNSFTFEEFSDGKEVFIFMNGWCSIRYFWTPYFNDFSPLGKCITLDLLGHYPSVVSKNFEKLDIEEIFHLQAKAIRSISNNKKVNLIGHSTGGMFALAIGSLYPDLVKKAVAITPLIHGPAKGILHFAKVLTDLKLNVSLEIFFNFIKNFPNLFHKWFEEAVFDEKEFLSKEENLDFILEYHKNFIKLDPNIMGRYLQTLHNSDIRPILKTSALKSLILGGSDDPIVPIDQQREAGSLLKNSKYVELTSCGHIPTLEKRGKSLEIIKSFLKN